jgi:DNA-binding CsgD family transcriptional regulator
MVGFIMSSDSELLDAAYRGEVAEAEWLSGLAEHSVSPLGARSGVYAYTYRIGARGIIALGGVAACEAAQDYWQALSAWGERNSPSIARLYATQVATLGQALRRARSMRLPMSDPTATFRAHGVRDILVVMGQDGSGGGLILAAPSPRTVELSAPQSARLHRIASELAVAHRMRTLRWSGEQNGEHRLSNREHEVAAGLRSGMSDKQIGDALGVSLSAVAEYAARLRGKLGCLRGEELMALRSASGASLAFRSQLFARLTPAEHSVACALVLGRSHAEIARERGVSPRTVASQLAAVFRKAGVSGRRELAARWFG